MKRTIVAVNESLAVAVLVVFSLYVFLYHGCARQGLSGPIWGAHRAPAPLPRPKAPPAPAIARADLVGCWETMTWRGGRGQTNLREDGTYECLWSGSLWVGTWTLVDGELSVCEGCGGGPPSFTWSFRVRRAAWGVDGGEHFRLER